MNKPWDIIVELESDNSRLAKDAIIKREVTANNAEFFRGFRAACDCMITFGIKKIETKKGDGKGLNSEIFWNTAKKLADRELTGNAAQVAVNHMRMNATEAEWNNWYRRILVKDMKCGVSETSINKFAPAQYQIPIFTCQLAYDGAKHESKVAGKKLIEVKLDGVRVITIVYPDGKVDQYSRNGKELLNFEHIKQQFAKHAVFLTEPMVFDGEVMSSSFQDLMKQVHRKSNVEANDAVLHLFDMLPLSEFRDGRSELDQVTRSQLLAGWHNLYASHMPNIAVVEQELVDLDTAEGSTRFAEINKAAIDGGYEGIMIKDPFAVYECDRTVAWLKIKPFIEVTLGVVDVEEGTGKNENNTGALVCEGTDDGVFIRVNVGGGLTDKMRSVIWADVDAVKGQLVEVRADAVTQNQDGSYSLRFPRFLRFRGFEPGEKL